MPNSTIKKFISLAFFLFLFFPFAQIKAQIFTESFKYNSVPSSLFLQGVPSAFLTGGAGSRDGYNDLNGNGYLRLTNTASTQKGIVWSTSSFSSTKEIAISFEYYIHGGNGGDGIALILFDENTYIVSPGEFGGSLGYAQANGRNGFTNGYLGVGIDEYGNFSSSDEGRNGGPTNMPSAIVLRGQGSGTSGYPYLTGVQTMWPPYSFNVAGNDRTATDPGKPGFRKIDILLKPRNGGGFFITVYLTHGNTKTLIIDGYPYTTPAPQNLKFAITASTGVSTNFHEIRNLNISSLSQPIANSDFFSGIVGLTATSADITANDNGTVNAPATLDKTSVDLDIDTPGVQNTKTVAGKGTFTYDSATGKVTFTPLDNTIEGSVQIEYTFNDTYGKTSNTSTITYNAITVKEVKICKGGEGSLMIDYDGTKSVTTFSGHWNAVTDPKAFIPTSIPGSPMTNTANCSFSTSASRNYTATQFTVSQSGMYTFKMTDTNDYDGMAYIYSGNFVPGKCNGGGRWIIGDDDYDGTEKEPRLIVFLEQGVTYTLISTLWATNAGTYAGDYTWTITPPAGGQFLLTTLNYWYTSAIGGIPIGWGNSFNPVGVLGSGLDDTNTAGTTIYYVGDETNAPRIPVSFNINEDMNVGMASSTPTICINTNLVSITHTTTNAKGIGIPIGLPSGVTATWASNLITISGIPTVSGTFNYNIPLTGDCGVTSATGRIVVTPKGNDIITTQTICSGQSYTWSANGIVYSTSQNELRISNDGCTADQILNLTVTPKPADIVTTKSICSGETYTWLANSIAYSDSQSGLKISNDGCTADQILNLTVTPKPADIVTTKSICSGETYTWPANGIVYSVSQNGLRISNDGCTADQILNLNVGTKPLDIVTTKSICWGETYTWPANRIVYSASQSGLRISNDGCTADQVLNLAVGTKPEDIVTTKSICSGQNYTWPANGIVYSTSQIGLRINNDGCTADQVLNLTIGTKPSDVVTTQSICAGETYTWPVNGIEYSASQTGLRISNDGCTADQILNLTVGAKPLDLVTTKSICAGETYTWPVNGIEYSTSQSRLRISNNGCTADQILNLTVTPKPADIVTTLSICSGETYTWPINGIVYSASQNGLRISNDGCTADQILNLTVTPKPADIVTTLSICSGETYNWPINGIVYSASQNGLRISNDGCTADQILNLTVGTKPSDVVTTKSICSGETYTWPANSIAYSASQNGLRISNDGCTADQILNLTVTPKPADIVTTLSICSGETYTWPINGIVYSASQNGLRISNDGCTADQILNLTVTPKPTDIVTTQSICAGQSYTWPANGITYSVSQTGLRISNDGCTADQILNLTFTPKPADIVTTKSICSGETYTWPANSIAYSTSQSGLRITNDGCTADQILNLTVTLKPADIVTTKSICAGETYTWPVNGIVYSTSQSELKISNDGCTADQVLNLTVGTKPTDIVTTQSICAGQSYTWPANGITYSVSQTGLRISNDGCTADQVLNLTVGTKPSDVVTTQSICLGQTFTWPANGIVYSTSQSGLRITNDGCTADQVLNLTVGTKPADIVKNENICFGDIFTWNVTGMTYTTPGTYTQNNDGCTADQVLNLTVGTKPEDIVTTKSICAGQNYTWPANGIAYFASQNGLRISNDGCTADQVLNLTVTPKPADIVTTKSICAGETYTWPANRIIYSASQSGLRITNDGCTADQILNLTVTPKPADIVKNENICFGDSFTWNVTGMTYTTPGTYTQNNDGCTADHVLNLTIGTKPSDVVTTKSICSGETYTWPVNGIVYSASQSGLRISNDGCTADQVLNLTVRTKPSDVVTTESICSGQNYTWPANGIVYSTSQIGFRINNDGCTSDQVLNLTVGTKPLDIVTTKSICSGQNYTWPANGIVYSTSQIGLRINNDGCTSDQVLNLTVGTKPSDIVTTKSICAGETYTWPANGIVYSASQNGLRISNDGCTADQVLNLSVGAKPTDIITIKSICWGETYTWPANGIVYSVSQNGLRISNDGCTADQVLNLTVTPKPADIVTTKSICAGETYTWPANGIVYFASQNGLRISNDRCTADQVLNLSVGAKPTDIITTISICSGQTYTWPVNGIVYSTSQSGLRITNDGCTPDQVLNLTVTPKPADIVTTKSICSEETYTWPVNGNVYSSSQTALRISNDGCTADQILNLTVTQKPTDIVTTQSICAGQSYTWPANGITYSVSQTGLRISNDGCTADQVLNLTVGTKPSDIVTTKSICAGESYKWIDNITHTTSQSGIRISNDGCTADQVLNLTVTPKPADIVTTKSICAGETYTWPVNGIEYSTSQSGLRISNDGCTADQVLNLSVGAKPNDIVTTKSICWGESYKWIDNVTYTTSQSGIRISNDGCTADQILNLTVGTKPEDIVTTKSICAGETYTWPANGIVYFASQNGLRISNDGCTADQVLNLTVTPKPADIVTTKSICVGETYTWPANRIVYSTSQSGLRINNDGCTADQILNLTVTLKPADIVTTKSICAGESYKWIDNITYTTSQSGFRISNDGCTADQIFNLTVGTKPEDIVTTKSICAGESYKWIDNVTYTTSQNGIRISNDGCTADQVLNLAVGTKPEDIVTTKSICAGESYKWIDNVTYTKSQNGIRISNDGCTADQVLNLIVALPLRASVIANSLLPELCSGENNGSFSIEISGGFAPYKVSLNKSDGVYEQAIGMEHSFSNISGSKQIVYIKDALECTFELQVVMPESVVLNPFVTVNYGCSFNSAKITIDASIDLLDVDYALDNGNYQKDNLFTNLSAGSHTVTARHTNGCTQSTKSFIIKHFEPLELSLTYGELNEIVAKATGGSGEYQYSFENQSFSKDYKFIIYKSGNYKVTVTDKNGCSTTVTQYFAYIDVCIPNYFTPNGDGVNDEWGPDCTVNYRNLTYTIIDRYGREIANYHYGQKWDGKYNGKELTSGDYWYVVKLNDPKDHREFVGHFTLYR